MDPHSLDTLLRDIHANYKNPSAFGVDVEEAVQWALLQSSRWGQTIARIHRWENWAKATRHPLPQDLGIDLMVELYDGSLIAVQSKGYDADRTGTSPEKKTVNVETVMKLVGLHPTLPAGTKLLVVTTGRGFGRNAAAFNAVSRTKVMVVDRQWMRDTGGFPLTLEALKAAVQAEKLRRRDTIIPAA
jgi:predicted helicase